MKKSFLVRTIILVGGLLLQMGALCFQSRGAAGDVDSSFGAGLGVNGTVTAITVQSDGKAIIGGDFTAVQGLSRPGIARLNVDGSGDATFAPAASFSNIRVADMTLQPDGKLLVCGRSRDSFAIAFAGRLNTNGTLDNTFVAAPEPPSQPESNGSGYTSVILQPDGKVLLGGYFSCCSDDTGELFPEVALVRRLNSNGTADASFGAPFGQFFTQITSLALQSNGRVLACGLSPSSLVRLNTNGSVDSSFDGAALYNVVSTAVQGDGKLLIAGNFQSVHGTNRNGIARLYANGNLDTTFDPGTGVLPTYNGGVAPIRIQSDGKILIGGNFTLFNGVNRNLIARLNANGSLDASFNPGTGADGIVRSLALQSDGRVLIGGDFTTVNGVVRPHVARLYGDSVAPSLNIARSNTFVIVSWPATGLNFQLQETADLTLPNSWFAVAQPAVTNAGQISVTVPTTVGPKFFRLKSQ